MVYFSELKFESYPQSLGEIPDYFPSFVDNPVHYPQVIPILVTWTRDNLAPGEFWAIKKLTSKSELTLELVNGIEPSTC